MAKGRMAIPKEIREAVIKKCGPKCFYCGKEGFVSTRYGKPVVLEKEPIKKWINEFDDTFIFTHRAMQFDHILPISRDGKTSVENMVICCSFCNASKKDNINGRWKNA
jgi:5-methylcytosine-specific restriction endonuclease McrA